MMNGHDFLFLLLEQCPHCCVPEHKPATVVHDSWPSGKNGKSTKHKTSITEGEDKVVREPKEDSQTPS